jgi:ribosome-binding factor A
MTRRINRVNELLRSEISHLIAREIKDPRVAGVISITEVVASSDLRSARVYVSVMGQEADRQAALEGIRSAASFLRRELRVRVNLRHTPHMTFVLDDSIEEGERVLRLMEGLTPEEFAADYLERTASSRRLRTTPKPKGQ